MKISAFLIASTFFLAGSANAIVINCGGDGGKFDRSSSIDTNGSSASVLNSDCGYWSGNDPDFQSMYGSDPSDWAVLDKADGSDGSLITGTNWGTSEGTFSLDDNRYEDYLIVLKFGPGFSAFLSDTGVINDWGWNTDPDGDGKHNLSHLSVYTRKPLTNSDVPAPASLAVMAIGLLGMLGWSTLRKLKTS